MQRIPKPSRLDFDLHGNIIACFLQVKPSFRHWVFIFKQATELFEGRAFGFWIQEPNDRCFNGEPNNVNDVKPVL